MERPITDDYKYPEIPLNKYIDHLESNADDLLKALQGWIEIFNPNLGGDTDMSRAAHELLESSLPPEIKKELHASKAAINKALGK